MTVQVDTTRFTTPEDYLAAEETAEYKSEYYDGEVFAMVGASSAHAIISVNLSGVMYSQLKGKPCRAYSSDMQVMVSETRFFYPDLSVVCGEPQFRNDKQRSLLNPKVVFEILSDSTERFDRGRKFEGYAGLASLTDYVLVAQDQPRLEHFSRRPDGDWLLHIADGHSSMLDIASIGCRLALADLYDRVEFQKAVFPAND
jgi:Uma2 family endonuclease